MAGAAIPLPTSVNGVQANGVTGAPFALVYNLAWANAVAGSIGFVTIKPNALSATGLALAGTPFENIQFKGITAASVNAVAGTVIVQSTESASVVGVSALGSAKTFTITEQLPISLVTAQAVGQAAALLDTIKPATLGGTSGLGSAGSALQQVSGVPIGNFVLGSVGSLILPANTAALVGASGFAQSGSPFVSEIITFSGTQSNGVSGSAIGKLNRNTGAATSLGSAGTLKLYCQTTGFNGFFGWCRR